MSSLSRRQKPGELEVRGVVVLRDPSGERLTADAKASAIVQERVVNSQVAREAEVRFRFSGHGNGVEFAAARVRKLVERVPRGDVRDEMGRIIGDFEKAGDLVQKELAARAAQPQEQGRHASCRFGPLRHGSNGVPGRGARFPGRAVREASVCVRTA